VATALEALVSLVNKLASGRAPSTFETWLYGLWCTTYSARKTKWERAADRGWRGHTSPCCQVSHGSCRTVRASIAGSLQMGVAVQGGAEAIIHTTRRLVLDHAAPSSDPDWALLQFDFSNLKMLLTLSTEI
jgi:hypothetical protein